MKTHISIFAFLLGAFAVDVSLADPINIVHETSGVELQFGTSHAPISTKYDDLGLYYHQYAGDLDLTAPEKDGYTISWLTLLADDADTWGGNSKLANYTVKIADGKTLTKEQMANAKCSSASYFYGYRVARLKYDAIPLTVTFNSNGGGGTMQPVTEKDITSAFSLPPCAFTKTGYSFANWTNDVGKVFTNEQSVNGSDFWNPAITNFSALLVAQWAENKYGISTSGENCTVTVSKTSDVKYTETVTVSWDPQTPQGHTRTLKSAEVLAGETELASFSSGTSGTFTMSAANKGYFANVTVKVVYEDTTNQYQVNVISGGNGSVSKTPNYSKYDFDSSVTISATPNEGYAFASWSDGGAQTHDVTVGAEDATYTATFTNCVYTLTWNANGGTFADGSSVSNVLIAYNSYIDGLPSATQPKKQLLGWHRDPTIHSPVFATDRYVWTIDMTLYAHWEDAPFFSVTGRPVPTAGGSVRGGGEKFEKGEAVTLEATANAGYEFLQWADGVQSPSRTVTVVGNAVFDALFTGKVYTVYFEPLGGTVAEDSRDYRYGETYKGFPTASREGWDFVGWFSKRQEGIRYREEDVFNVPLSDNDITFYAHWTERASYHVTFDGEDATSGSMVAQRIYCDEETVLSSNAFKRTGHAFLGWAETNDLGRVKYADGTNVLNIAKAGDTNELHAVWSANTYTVTFDPNGAEGTMADQAFVYDQQQALNPCTFVRGDPQLWSFEGWTNSAAGGRLYAPGETVLNLTDEPNGRVVLTAVWRSTIGPLSEAMGCDNLKWVSETDDKGNDVWVVCTTFGSGGTCAQLLPGHSLKAMLANISTNGTLRFKWQPANSTEKLYVRINPDGGTPSETSETGNVGQWNDFELKVEPDLLSTTGDTQIEIFLWGDGTCYVDQMTWTPEGSEPTPGEPVGVTAAGVEGDVFSLTIPTTDGTDYGVWTNADVTVPAEKWGLMEKKKAGGGTLDFSLQILPGMPQLFFRAYEVK